MSTTTVVRERPIIFSGPMVRAIVEGRKTQTRRVVKGVDRAHQMLLSKPTKTQPGICTHVIDAPKHGLCPYGQPGDLLYVLETGRVVSEGIEYAADDELFDMDDPRAWPLWNQHAHEDGPDVRPTTIPSIHMPKWASRLWLRVTDVRVERVQEIATGDVWAEGIERPACLTDPSVPMLGTEVTLRSNARNDFRDLWDSLNAGRGYSWESNPWVWKASFERADAP